MGKHKKYIFRVLRNAVGDNLERARAAFRSSNLDAEYGESGKTCREILETYERERVEHDAAVKWLKGL